MKKSLIFLMLLISLTTFAQSEYKKIYTVTYSEKEGHNDNENIFIFNYKETSIVKVITSAGAVHFFDQTSEFTERKTDSGYEYYSATFVDQENNKRVLFQIFKNNEYGMRLTFEDLQQIQFFE